MLDGRVLPVNKEKTFLVIILFYDAILILCC